MGASPHYAAGDSRVLKTARDTAGAEVHTAYIFPSLELRRAQFNTATAGDYTLTSTTEVGYLFANGVRLARLAQQPLDSAGDSNLLRVFFELGDHLGSTSVVLDKGTGELVERDTYQVYGGAESSYRPSKWGDFREDYRFTGKEEDVEVGLTYFGKRFYNALLQRWVSPDPLEVHETASGEPNVYAYVSGSPVKNVDPIGLEVKLTTDTPPPTPTAKIHTFEQGKSSQHTTISRAHAQSAPSGTGSTGQQNLGDGFDPVADLANADADKFGTGTGSGSAEASPVQDALIGAAFANAETPDAISTTPGVGDPGGIPGGFCTTNCTTGLGPQIGYLFMTVAAVATGGGKADDVLRAAKSVGQTVVRKAGEAVEATKAVVKELRRPYLRKNVRAEIDARAPRDASGRPLDPNLGTPIDGKPDIGHKPGHEFRREKAQAEAEGLTQKEFNDRMNDPDLYQLESPGANRGHRFEQKP